MWRAAAALARCLPAEAAHRVAVQTLRLNIGPKPDVPSMPVTVAGIRFDNPLGLAAGFDKNAECFSGAMRLGFGHVEIGTVTPLPQPGNPRPRVFRLPVDRGVINRYGFNGNGMEYAARNLAAVNQRTAVLGVNVGANKTSADPIEDYHVAVARLAAFADYVTLNISSPNTPGLRDLQADQLLQHLLAAGRSGLAESGKKIPLFLKMAPDLQTTEIRKIVACCVDHNVDGIIATNTTVARPEGLSSPDADEQGGLSGAPLFAMSTAVLAEVAALAKGRLAVIGVGGVASGWQAYAKLLVGADLVQLYTGLALDGPGLPASILAEMKLLMDYDGYGDVASASGQIPDAREAISHALHLAQSSGLQVAAPKLYW
jgi:dihydroorotate dehydrogenase